MTTIVGTGLEGYIKRNARERALNRIAEAEIEARRLVERAEQRAATITEEAASQIEASCASMRQRTLAQADIEASGLRLRRREALLRQVWQRAREQLGALSAAERLESLVALVLDAATQLGGGELRLQVSSADASLLSPEVMDALVARTRSMGVTDIQLLPTPADVMGGVVVSALPQPGAAQRLVDNSWDERLRLAYDAFRDEITAMLAAPAGGQFDDRGAL